MPGKFEELISAEMKKNGGDMDAAIKSLMDAAQAGDPEAKYAVYGEFEPIFQKALDEACERLPKGEAKRILLASGRNTERAAEAIAEKIMEFMPDIAARAAEEMKERSESQTPDIRYWEEEEFKVREWLRAKIALWPKDRLIDLAHSIQTVLNEFGLDKK